MANEVTQPAYEEAEIAKEICRGQGDRFKGIPCEQYDKEAMHCRLLRDHKSMRPVLDYGRCLSIPFFQERVDLIITWIEKYGPEAVLRLMYGQKSAYKRYRKLREQRASEPSQAALMKSEARAEAHQITETSLALI